ncbi:MAG TPA: class I SAM-dependent methyltransferase [Chitinophagales bacterium]|nr:class I SAM-dependent methyltransferase [Chitinophagales bacterium]HNM29517.1 class I SAM-dependent methyltransferase [Chitinophagales bacterium]HNO28078.1 class I SAM-dependent methyltransferase [Chitinophagales bacterium]
MQYDPVKRSLGKVFNTTPVLRIVFYKMLDLLLLRAWHIHKALRQWSKGKKETEQHILDAGSGFGQYSYFLSGMSNKWKFLSVDVKEEQIADCNNFFQKIGRKNIRFQVKDLTTFTIPDHFDLVVCVDVMEHVLEDVQVFKNYHTSLKTGGMVLISTPSDQGGSDVHEETGSSFIEEHVRDGYNIQEIQDKLTSAGFTRTEAHYAYGTPGKISWRLSMKYPLQLLNISKLFFIILPVYYIITFPFCLLLNACDVAMSHKTGTGLIVKAWK